MTLQVSLRTLIDGVDRWIVRLPVAAFLIWFFTVGQAFAFVPLVARHAYGSRFRLSCF